VDFLQGEVPLRIKTSEQIISHDKRSNTSNFHYTFALDIVPICRYDLVFLPRAVLKLVKLKTPFALCIRIATGISLIDPFTTDLADIPGTTFWKTPFNALANFYNLIEFTVIDLEILRISSDKYTLAEVTVARSSDFGVNDHTFIVKSHLGRILRPGDFVLGYDLATINTNDKDAENWIETLQEVILVCKKKPEKKRDRKKVNQEANSESKEKEAQEADSISEIQTSESLVPNVNDST